MDKYQIQVHLLYVIEDGIHHQDRHGEFGQTHIDKTQEWEKKTAKKGLDQICDKYLKECPLYIKHIGTGDPARAILRFIENEKVDMVAVATCGSKGHSPLGSVAEKVLKNSYVSVVTVPIRSEQ